MSNESGPSSQPPADSSPPPASGAPSGGEPSRQAPAKSGTPVLLWVLLGCGGVAFIFVVLFVLVAIVFVRQVEESVDVKDGNITIRGTDGEKVTFSGKKGESELIQVGG